MAAVDDRLHELWEGRQPHEDVVEQEEMLNSTQVSRECTLPPLAFTVPGVAGCCAVQQ